MLVDPRYQLNILKEYEYWTLLLHERQSPYVGRCYAWWKDRSPGEGEGLALYEIPIRATLECYQIIMQDLDRAYANLDWYATEHYGESFLLHAACLCNEIVHHNAHLHVHFIPRYSSTLVIPEVSMTFTDELWGKHYLPMKDQTELRPHEHRQVHQLLASALDD